MCRKLFNPVSVKQTSLCYHGRLTFPKGTRSTFRGESSEGDRISNASTSISDDSALNVSGGWERSFLRPMVPYSLPYSAWRSLMSTEDILAEASASSSVVSHLQLRMSTLQREVDGIQNNDANLSVKMQNINTRFQNVTDTWRKSLDEISLDTNLLKSETKSLFSQITAKTSSAEQSLKILKEKIKDLEDSTLRNARTVKNQEENEFDRVEEMVDSNTKAIESLEKEQMDLADIHFEVQQNRAKLKPKVEECIQNLPTIEKAIRTLLKVSYEMVELDKKMNDLTVQVFSTEDNLLKTISEILEIQNTLERIQIDNSILKMQNDIGHLKERAYTELANPEDSLIIEEEKETEPANGQP
uniref:Uncharacterized protein n=1 Tax=Xenopus tropicalis TaxID=8364 RepID=A0A6I8S355_XENTR